MCSSKRKSCNVRGNRLSLNFLYIYIYFFPLRPTLGYPFYSYVSRQRCTQSYYRFRKFSLRSELIVLFRFQNVSPIRDNVSRRLTRTYGIVYRKEIIYCSVRMDRLSYLFRRFSSKRFGFIVDIHLNGFFLEGNGGLDYLDIQSGLIHTATGF